jgi:autotransporter-associated beta strand protein
MAVLMASVAQAQTLRYWGGGTASLTDNTALTPVTGNWGAAGVRNWGDQDGVPAPENAVFNAWANGDAAVFGTRTGSYNANVQAGGVVVGGLATYLFDGTGVGAPAITGPSGGTAPFTINPGATVNLAAGTTLAISSTTAAQQGVLTITNSGFTITGGGVLSVTTYNGTFASAGTLTVSNGTLRIANTSSQTPFANNTLELVFPNGRYDQGRYNDWASSPWPAIIGSGTVQPLTTGTGFRPLCLNNATNTTLDARLLDGTPLGVLTVLYKDGAGALTVMNPNSAYFGNFVRNGTLSPGAANAVKGWVLVDGASTPKTGIFATTNGTFFAGSATAVSGGQVNGANLALHQIQIMAGGALKYDAADEIPGSGRVLDGTQKGAVIVGGYAFDDSFLQRIKEPFDGVIALGADIGSGTTLHFDGAGGNFTKARLGAWGAPRTFDGTLAANNGNCRLGGGNNTLTLTSALTGTGSLDVNNGPNKGYFGQASATLPTCGVTLTADNTLSGPVTVGNGVTLTLSGSNGSLSGATGITVTEGGILNLPDGQLNSDRLPAVGVKLLNGAALNFSGSSTPLETVGPLTIDGGYSTLTSSQVNSAGTPTLEFAQLSATNWGTVNFTVNSSTRLRFATDPVAAGTMIGPWAIAGSTFAVYQTNSYKSVVAMPASMMPTVASDAAWLACNASSNVYLTAGFTASEARTVASLRNYSNTAQINSWTGLNKVDSGGISVLNNGGNGTLFTNGQWTASSADHGLYLYNLEIWRSFTFSSAIVDDDASSVTLIKSGPGLVTLTSAANSFSGGVVLNAGMLRTLHQNALGNSTALTFNGRGAILDPSSGTDARTFNQAITVNADGTLLGIIGTGGSTTLNGDITLANNCLFSLGQFDLSRPVTVNGKITGTGSFRLRSTSVGLITLQGPVGNDYIGDTFVAAVVALNKSSGNAVPGDVYLGTVESSSNSSGLQRPTLRLSLDNQIADTAVLIFGGGVGGVDTNALSPLFRLNGKSDQIGGLSSPIGNGVVENGSNATASVLTLGGSGAYAFGGLLRNGSASGTLALTKAGTGTQALSYANTYSGDTAINGGTLLVRNAAGSGTGSGNVAVGASGTLGGDGRLAPGAGKGVAVSGTVSPGASVGNLTVDLAGTALGVTLNSGAKLGYELGAPGAGDLLTFVSFGSGDLSLNSNVIDFTDAGGLAEGEYTLMEFYSDDGSTLTDTGKPTSGLVIGAGLGAFPSSRISYSQTGKIVLKIQKPQGTVITIS